MTKDASIIPTTSTDNPPEAISIPSNTPSATPSNTQSNGSEITKNLESYSSGLTPELMRLLDEPVENPRAEPILPFETNYAVAFPRIEVPAKSPDRTQTVNNEVQGQDDSIKDDQLKLETVLRDIGKQHNSFMPTMDAYGTLTGHRSQPFGINRHSTTNFNTAGCGKITNADTTVIQLPGGLGTITEKDVDEFVDSLIRRNLQRQQQKNQLSSRSYVNFDPETEPSMSPPISTKPTSKAYFTVDHLPPSEASANLVTANQKFHSPPKEYGIPSNEEKQAASSKEAVNLNNHDKISTKVEKKNETAKDLFSPKLKFFYQFGDGNTNDMKTALYHVHQLKTQHPTVVSLQPSTENLHEMINTYAKDNSLHLIEMPYREKSGEEGSKSTQSKPISDQQ